MTVAALQALLLADLARDSRDALGQRFFQAAGAMIDSPWATASAADQRLIRSAREPTLLDGAGDYSAAVRARAAEDPVVARAFLRVTNLLDPPSRLAEPDIVARVTGSGAA